MRMTGKASIPRPQGATETFTASDYIAVVASLLGSKTALDGGSKFSDKVQF